MSSYASSPTVVMGPEVPSRAALRRARRVCVKAGTSVVANENGRPSLTRLGAIAEQISELCAQGVQVIFVSSGAVGMGKRLLRKQSNLLLSFRDLQDGGGVGGTSSASSNNEPEQPIARTKSFELLLNTAERPHSMAEKKRFYDSACASAGQFEMMNLYSALFNQCDVVASQILVTQQDFIDSRRVSNLSYAVERLLTLGIVPIINENDAVSANLGYTADDVFSDNDSLAALCARHFGAEVLLLLTDVPGVYDRPPTEPGAVLLPHYRQKDNSVHVIIGEKSAQGRGGMASKIDAAVSAVKAGSKCRACVVASGSDLNSIRAVLAKPTGSSNNHASPPKGTLFCTPDSELELQACIDFPLTQTTEEDQDTAIEGRRKAKAARTQARKFQALPYAVRQDILRAMAAALVERQDELLAANALDLQAAERDAVSDVLKKRLGLTPEKLATLAAGLTQIANIPDPLNVVKIKREVTAGLELSLVSVPIGVLLVIFESRPDSMPQITSLALASGNGLLLKGGKEATHSNAALYQVLGDAIESGSGGQITRDIVALITTRGQVDELLTLDDSCIDLVIPRGGNALVSYIKAHTRIPVLGHADGVCHVYVDGSASQEAACRIAVDAKTDYPAACNAMETLLLHEDTVLKTAVGPAVLMALRAAGVKCLGGPRAMKLGLCDNPATEAKHEYGDLTCQVEVVSNLDEAVEWIHANGSGHTETIVCSPELTSTVGEEFLRKVDAACVFVNASTRFADGFRFGLGAEVGISTGRIHARGPVGVEGLLTTKWQLRSTTTTNTDATTDTGDATGSPKFYCVADFSGDSPKMTYTHKELPLL